jgi:hypothetical protein
MNPHLLKIDEIQLNRSKASARIFRGKIRNRVFYKLEIRDKGLGVTIKITGNAAKKFGKKLVAL